jgi:hypothetical protein
VSLRNVGGCQCTRRNFDSLKACDVGWFVTSQLHPLIDVPGCLQVLSPTTPEIIDQIHELVLEDRRISAKSVVEQLGISRERVGSIIHEDLDMLVACFLPGRAKDLSAPLYG